MGNRHRKEMWTGELLRCQNMDCLGFSLVHGIAPCLVNGEGQRGFQLLREVLWLQRPLASAELVHQTRGKRSAISQSEIHPREKSPTLRYRINSYESVCLWVIIIIHSGLSCAVYIFGALGCWGCLINVTQQLKRTTRCSGQLGIQAW